MKNLGDEKSQGLQVRGLRKAHKVLLQQLQQSFLLYEGPLGARHRESRQGLPEDEFRGRNRG